MAKKQTTKKTNTATQTKKASTKKAETAKPKKVSQIDAAIKVLGTARKPMSCKELVEAMTKKKLWTSPGGATPDATLYASILRDLKKGKTGIEYLACVLILRLESGSLMEMDINKLDIDSLPSGEFFL